MIEIPLEINVIGEVLKRSHEQVFIKREGGQSLLHKSISQDCDRLTTTFKTV
jgi:hypothetical protein